MLCFFSCNISVSYHCQGQCMYYTLRACGNIAAMHHALGQTVFSAFSWLIQTPDTFNWYFPCISIFNRLSIKRCRCEQKLVWTYASAPLLYNLKEKSFDVCRYVRHYKTGCEAPHSDSLSRGLSHQNMFMLQKRAPACTMEYLTICNILHLIENTKFPTLLCRDAVEIDRFVSFCCIE